MFFSLSLSSYLYFTLLLESSFLFYCNVPKEMCLLEEYTLIVQLPVLSIDISHDSRLIITSSADKNIKIWGLDFGDCHRSIFAHDESVMQVAFEKGSHMFWSVGKDRSVKYWDGDKVCFTLSCALPSYCPTM
jgi:WD40 repeat protein